MVLLVITGIKEELSVLLDRHPFSFEKDLRIYRSSKYQGLYATTTGPGIRHPNRLRKILEALHPDVIINAGLVGLLDERNSHQTGDRIKLGQVVRSDTGIVYPGGPGQNILVTVDRPIFDLLDKIDLAEKHKADACDMEAAKLIEMVGSIDALRNHSFVHFVKIVGDRPEDAALYEYEYMLWNWQYKSFWNKLYTLLTFPGGSMAGMKLKRSKTKALAGLGKQLFISIQAILQANGIPHNLGSTFVPH